AAAERVITGVDFVAECLADLSDAEWQFQPCAVEDVAVVDKDTLGGLRPKISFTLLIAHRAAKGLKHKIEGSRFRQFSGTIMVWTGAKGLRYGANWQCHNPWFASLEQLTLRIR